jgi:hypothetical protein
VRIIRVKRSVYHALFNVYGDDIAKYIPSGYKLLIVCDFTGLLLSRT